jgi:hypothetical protein
VPGRRDDTGMLVNDCDVALDTRPQQHHERLGETYIAFRVQIEPEFRIRNAQVVQTSTVNFPRGVVEGCLTEIQPGRSQSRA